MTRIIVRYIFRVQIRTRHGRFAIITLIDRNMGSVIQIASAANLDIVILISILKDRFGLSARRAHRRIGGAIKGERCGAAVVGGREEIVGDGVYP